MPVSNLYFFITGLDLFKKTILRCITNRRRLTVGSGNVGCLVGVGVANLSDEQGQEGGEADHHHHTGQ